MTPDEYLTKITGDAVVAGPEAAMQLRAALAKERTAFDDGCMDGYGNCLSMVHQHIKELGIVYLGNANAMIVLDRLYNRIAEDTK